jgi:glucose-6-phosphate dehydrogenase assembly protein OpcA
MTESAAVWSEQGTTPSAIDAALRELLKERRARGEACAPARVLNLIVVADREWRGEVLDRLERVGRYHASRTIVCAIEDGRTEIDARATVEAEEEVAPEQLAVAHEEVVLDIGPKHVKHLDRIVDPLVVTDLPTVVWSPHHHPEAVEALLGLAQVVLIDSVDEPDPAEAIGWATELSERAYVVDLAWLRSTPWRERVAATFDPPNRRSELDRIDAVTVRHHPDSIATAALLCGWLGIALGWEAGPLTDGDGRLSGVSHRDGGEVRIALDPDPTMPVPGLAGLTIGLGSGGSLSLDRGPGGLTAERRSADGRTLRWTVLGASRGEAGILGEGIRQALLRDKAYGRSLRAAATMVGR